MNDGGQGHLDVESISFMEQIDAGGTFGRVVLVLVGAIAKVWRSLIKEREKTGLKQVRLEGPHIGGPKLLLDHKTVLEDRVGRMGQKRLGGKHEAGKAGVC